MLNTVAELFEALGRNPDELIGQPERDWLDFKLEPYLLDATGPERDKVCLELAKDVTSFANEDEGVILIGVRAEREPASQVEVAKELRPPPAGMVDPVQIQAIAREWAFPPLDVEVGSHSVPGTDRKLWSIYVKRQRDRDKPFIVAREFGGAKGPNRNLFGVYHRVGTDNVPYPVELVWNWINRGWSEPPPAPPSALKSPPDADSVLEADLRAIGLDPRASLYYVQAMPQRSSPLTRFYRGAHGSMYDRLLNLNHIRPAGFNLPDGLEPMRTEIGALREVWEENDSLSVTPLGLTTAVQGQRHLTWAYENMARRGQLWINPVALVEFTLEFWRFYVSEVCARIESPSPTVWRAGMRGLTEPHPLFLPASFSPGAETASPLADSFSLDWSSTDEDDPGVLAFDTLSLVYGYYGFAEELIPHSEGRRVSEQSIRDIKRATG